MGLPKTEAVAMATVASEGIAEAAKPEVEIKDIVNQTFENQEVLLDGYRYIACTFINVTFVYNNGPTDGFDPASCKWTGSVGFKSRDERIQSLLGFLKSLRIIRPEAEGRYTPILAPVSSPTAMTNEDKAHREWARTELDKITHDPLDAYNRELHPNHEQRMQYVKGLQDLVLGKK
jgi:hypothetical protein